MQEIRLYILPFDHRATFIKDLFGYKEPLSKKQLSDVRGYKKLIWKAFLRVYEKTKDKKPLGILVDEEFGSGILREAKKAGAVRIVAAEKSGQKVFDFEYGKKFGQHILRVKPDYSKVLVRYNPKNKKDNIIQLKRLKMLDGFCKKRKIGFLLELLVPATELQSAKKDYDSRIRPVLTAEAIKEIRAFGIEPDIWKMEAMPGRSDWKRIVEAVKYKNKKPARIIVLGRAGSKKQVSSWFKIASGVKEVIGFAVGRTIFLPPLEKYHEKKISKKQAISLIAGDFGYFIDCWKRNRK